MKEGERSKREHLWSVRCVEVVHWLFLPHNKPMVLVCFVDTAGHLTDTHFSLFTNRSILPSIQAASNRFAPGTCKCSAENRRHHGGWKLTNPALGCLQFIGEGRQKLNILFCPLNLGQCSFIPEPSYLALPPPALFHDLLLLCYQTTFILSIERYVFCLTNTYILLIMSQTLF